MKKEKKNACSIRPDIGGVRCLDTHGMKAVAHDRWRRVNGIEADPGTRHYYRKLGYELEGPYMTKWLTEDGKPPPNLGTNKRIKR